MSDGIRNALIGAAATILAALIGGYFVVYASQYSSSDATTPTVSATKPTTPDAPSLPPPSFGETTTPLLPEKPVQMTTYLSDLSGENVCRGEYSTDGSRLGTGGQAALYARSFKLKINTFGATSKDVICNIPQGAQVFTAVVGIDNEESRPGTIVNFRIYLDDQQVDSEVTIEGFRRISIAFQLLASSGSRYLPRSLTHRTLVLTGMPRGATLC